MTSNAPRVGISSILPVLLASPPDQVEFSCPWCSTRLSLPKSDFGNERAVLCPRCNNPIDMEIQRKLYKVSGPPPAPAAPQRAPPGQRRDVTLPRPRPMPTKSAAGVQTRSAQEVQQKGPEPPADEIPVPPAPSWEEHVAMDDFFGSEASRRKEMDALMGGAESGRQVGSHKDAVAGAQGPAAPAPKVKCPACGFDNVSGYDPFRTGPPKCAWCGALLPP
jgi:hypothetical protein